MSTTPTEIIETTAAMLETTAAAVAETEAALDLQSIKEMMDGFDPAALLPELDRIFDSLPAVCRVAVLVGPIVLLALGLSYLFLSPKEANYYLGYRTYFGMGSVQAWRFTQRLAGIVFGALGIGMTVMMLVITGKFGAMETDAMVWQALECLVWEAGLSLAAVLGVNLTAMIRFDRKGDRRKK